MTREYARMRLLYSLLKVTCGKKKKKKRPPRFGVSQEYKKGMRNKKIHLVSFWLGQTVEKREKKRKKREKKRGKRKKVCFCIGNMCILGF